MGQVIPVITHLRSTDPVIAALVVAVVVTELVAVVAIFAAMVATKVAKADTFTDATNCTEHYIRSNHAKPPPCCKTTKTAKQARYSYHLTPDLNLK